MNKTYRYRGAIIFILIFIATIYSFSVVYFFGTSWPQIDSFNFLFIIKNYRSNNLDIYNLLFARNNEHMVGLHYITSLIILILAGLNFKILLYTSALLLVLSIFYLLRTTLPKSSKGLELTLVGCIVLITLLNPVQASYLLWEFQVWWYWLLFFFTLTIFLIERFGLRVYPFIFILCLAGSFFSTQGLFLWLTAGLHYTLLSFRNNSFHRKYTVYLFISTLHAIIFFTFVYLIFFSSQVPISADKRPDFDIMSFLIYFTQLVGGGFGIRTPTYVLVLGAVSLFAFCFASIVCIKNKWFLTQPIARAGLIMACVGMLCTLAFAFGRQKYGIEWALWTFHGAPTLLPFFTGLGLIAMACFHGSKEWPSRIYKYFFPAVCFISILPSFMAVRTGYDRAKELLRNTSSAQIANCNEDKYPLYLRLRLNGLGGQDFLYNQTKAIIMENCKRSVNMHAGKSLLEPPIEYFSYAKGNADQMEALTDLWWVYVTHLDLQRNFPFDDQNTSKRLLSFAINNAKINSVYEKILLPKHQNIFLQMSEN